MWPQQKSFHPLLSLHSLLACPKLLTLLSFLSFTYSCTLSYHFIWGLPLLPTKSTELLYTYSPHHCTFIHSLHVTKPPQDAFDTFHHTRREHAFLVNSGVF